MILQTLKEYYDRIAANPEMDIAPEGWETKEIPFIIVLTSDGHFHHIEDTREIVNKKKIGKSFIVPLGEKRSSGIAANLLWDNPGYVLGVISDKTMAKAEKESKKANDNGEKIKKLKDRTQKSRENFFEVLQTKLADCEFVKPIFHFLQNIDFNSISQDPLWDELRNSDAIITFRILGDDCIVCNNKDVKNHINRFNNSLCDNQKKSGVCAITGETDDIERIHKAIQGVWGAQTSGANIVSFNFPASASYGKRGEQGLNASIGKKAAFAYTTALNTLLSKNSRNRLQIGDTSTVFWAVKECDLENYFSVLFSEPPSDNPNALCEAVKELFDSIHTGKYLKNDEDNEFHILGLAPNSARISIRFWKTGKISDFARNIAQHFCDMSIVKPLNETEHYSLFRILLSVAVQGKSDNIPPKLAGEVLRAIIDNTPYPISLLQATLQRIRCEPERRVTPIRASIIKACINRFEKYFNLNRKEITMSLDIHQPSIGYQLGRLFAVLAKIQTEAQPGINATIRDRFYASACATPVTVFANLLRLKNHHLAKIEAKGRVIFFENLLGEIIGKLSVFPAHLDMAEQGKFAIGYYHQWQSFFEKKSVETN